MAACERVRFAGGMRIEQFGAEDGRRADACYEIFRATRMADDPEVPVMPPTGKAFAITQTHWFRTRDGVITEHWANRDDLAMARQAGWVPPSPGFLLRAAIAKRRTRPHPA